MEFRKILAAGLVSGIISDLWGLLTCQWLFKWLYSIEPTNIYKIGMLSGRKEWLISMGIGKIIIAVILAFGYSLTYKIITSKTALTKGIVFGLLVWLIGMLPSRFLLYMSINISPAMISYWTLNDLINYILLGAIIGITYKE